MGVGGIRSAGCDRACAPDLCTSPSLTWLLGPGQTRSLTFLPLFFFQQSFRDHTSMFGPTAPFPLPFSNLVIVSSKSWTSLSLYPSSRALWMKWTKDWVLTRRCGGWEGVNVDASVNTFRSHTRGSTTIKLTSRNGRWSLGFESRNCALSKMSSSRCR